MDKKDSVTEAYQASVSAANAASWQLNLPFFTAENGQILAHYADGKVAVVGVAPIRAATNRAQSKIAKPHFASRS